MAPSQHPSASMTELEGYELRNAPSESAIPPWAASAFPKEPLGLLLGYEPCRAAKGDHYSTQVLRLGVYITEHHGSLAAAVSVIS